MSEFNQDNFDGAADKMSVDMSEGRNDGRPRARRRRKVSFLTLNKIEYVDYKDIATLQKFLTERGKITAARQNGNTAKQQRMISNAIKSAREMALIPFVVRDAVDTGSRRRMTERNNEDAPVREAQEATAESSE
jgi:small subunit ribosomal protein S18